MLDQYHHPLLPSDRSFTIYKDLKKTSEILSTENNVALSATDTIYHLEVEYDNLCSMTGGNTVNGKQFISLCMLGHPQIQNDQLLIMTKGKGLEYDDQENFCSMLHLFLRPLFMSEN